MPKKKKPKRNPHKPKPLAEKIALRTFEKIAAKEGTTPEMVRKHLQVGLINGLISDDPATKAALARIPKAGDVLIPEELIAYYATALARK